MEETMLRKFSSQQYYKIYQNRKLLCTLFLKRNKSTIIKNSGTSYGKGLISIIVILQ